MTYKQVDPRTIPEDPRAPGKHIYCDACGYIGYPIIHPGGGFGCPQCVGFMNIIFLDQVFKACELDEGLDTRILVSISVRLDNDEDPAIIAEIVRWIAHEM